MQRREVAYERRTLRKLDRRLDRLADFLAADPWLWKQGDGEGGGVIRELARKLVERGVDRRAMPSSVRDLI